MSAESNITKENKVCGGRDSTFASNTSTNKHTVERAIISPKQFPNLNKTMLQSKAHKVQVHGKKEESHKSKISKSKVERMRRNKASLDNSNNSIGSIKDVRNYELVKHNT